MKRLLTTLILLGAIDSHASTVAFVPLHTIAVTAKPAPGTAYAFDGTYEYLGTSDGLWRSEHLADRDAPLERIAFAGQQIVALAAANGVLYVSRQAVYNSTNSEHSLLVSTDHGASFTPIDEGLRDCSLDCGYMTVERIVVDGGDLFVTAGGNLMVSRDGGAHWTKLFPADGRPAGVQTCPLVFDLAGDRLLTGGECPLDVGWIGGGVLAPARTDWTVAPVRVNVEQMQNRNVQYIEHLAGGRTVFAAVEGGMLRSDDGGATYRWAVRYELSNARAYPYMRHFVRSPAMLPLMLSGGFDKKSSRPFLMMSNDGGYVWTDISYVLPPVPPGFDTGVTMLATDRDGRMLAALMTPAQLTMGELVVHEDAPAPRRRAAGR